MIRFGATGGRVGFDQHVDWTHGNGLSYYPEKRAVLASFRNQCAVVSIDLDTKNINWILGKHDNWPEHLRDKLLKPIGDQFMWPCYQHNPRYTSQGTVIMFDNRANGAKMPFEPRPKNYSENFSRAVEYKIDDESMTIEQIWTTGDEQGEDPCYSFAMSDAWRLPETDNRLVIYAFCAVLDDTLTEDIMDETKRSGDDLPYGGVSWNMLANKRCLGQRSKTPMRLFNGRSMAASKAPQFTSLD